jgi:hypothetical protein
MATDDGQREPPALSQADMRAQLALLSRTLGREAHILTREPEVLPSHLHNMIFLDEGDDGPGGPLLARARDALADRPWLRLTNRPPVPGRQALIRVLEHEDSVHGFAWSPDGHTLAAGSSARQGALPPARMAALRVSTPQEPPVGSNCAAVTKSARSKAGIQQIVQTSGQSDFALSSLDARPQELDSGRRSARQATVSEECQGRNRVRPSDAAPRLCPWNRCRRHHQGSRKDRPLDRWSGSRHRQQPTG